MAFEVRIPTLGESVTEGDDRALGEAGRRDASRADEVLLELETDKASMEIPAEQAGVLRIVKRAGATVTVGEVVAASTSGAGARAPQAGRRPRRAAAAAAHRSAAPPPQAAAAGGPATRRRRAPARGRSPSRRPRRRPSARSAPPCAT